MIVTSRIDSEQPNVNSEALGNKDLVCIREPSIARQKNLDTLDEDFNSEDRDEEEVEELRPIYSKSALRFVLGRLNLPSVVRLPRGTSLVKLISGVGNYIDLYSADVYSGRDIYIIGIVPESVPYNYIVSFDQDLGIDLDASNGSFSEEFRYGMIVDLYPVILGSMDQREKICSSIDDIENFIDDFRKASKIVPGWNFYKDFIEQNRDEADYMSDRFYAINQPSVEELSFPAKLVFNDNWETTEVVLFNSLTSRFGEKRIQGRLSVRRFSHNLCKNYGMNSINLRVIGRPIDALDIRRRIIPEYLGVEELPMPEQMDMLNVIGDSHEK